MEESQDKKCTGCKQPKAIGEYEMSPRTGKPYPKCRVCRDSTAVKAPSQHLRDKYSDRLCPACNHTFTPKRLYQKICSDLCQRRWETVRDTLAAAGPKQLVLTNGLLVTVDGDDFEYLCQFNWFGQSGGSRRKRLTYPVASVGAYGAAITMANYIMETPEGKEVDHQDHETMNHRRNNLRVCTHQQNLCNQQKRAGTSSLYKGVSWNKENNSWRAYIVLEGVYRHLGVFPVEEEIEAALAYDRAAQEAFGEFACLNFPEHAGARVLASVG